MGSLNGDLVVVLERLIAELESTSGSPGVSVWGGETTLVLPDNPGRGGRNQHLALCLAEHLDGVAGISVLCAGTDGTDGPTSDAGGLINGDTVGRGRALGLNIQTSIVHADAGNYLEKTQALFTTGPTGTNVMDLVIALRS
jgi:hydroxypyruvate reductase